jgi:hypothetical protein
MAPGVQSTPYSPQNFRPARFSVRTSSSAFYALKLVEEDLGVFQISDIEAFDEPVIDIG